MFRMWVLFEKYLGDVNFIKLDVGNNVHFDFSKPQTN
jgi:hypothetical protein